MTRGIASITLNSFNPPLYFVGTLPGVQFGIARYPTQSRNNPGLLLNGMAPVLQAIVFVVIYFLIAGVLKRLRRSIREHV